MNKKASSILLLIFEIIVVVLVVFLTSRIATNYASSDSIVKINTANDLDIMINALVGVPGEAFVEYPQKNISQFTFTLTPTMLEVKIGDEPKFTRAKVDLHLPEGYTAEGFLKEAEDLCLEKKRKKIKLRECNG